jgi:hypothetical protein
VAIIGSHHQLTTDLARQASSAGWVVTDRAEAHAAVCIAVSPPVDDRAFARHHRSIAVVTGDELDWVRSGGLDASTEIVVPDLVAGARLAAAWAPDIARIERPISSDDGAFFERLVGNGTEPGSRMRIGVATCARTARDAPKWGDTYLAQSLMRSFRREGHVARELIKPEWQAQVAQSCDAVVHLRGLARRPIIENQLNILWIISHPERVERTECDEHDIIASASRQHAEQLSRELGREVHFVPQAADVDTFRTGRSDPFHADSVLYVGNARWPNRRAPRWLMQAEQTFDLFGAGWEGTPEASARRGEFISNRDLAAAYRSAAVVVADHHGSMRSGGFVANRLFDVLASGGTVVSDDVTGLDELFAGAVPTYSDQRSLERCIRGLLADERRRRRLGAEGHEIVMANHTMDHRAQRFLDLLGAPRRSAERTDQVESTP